MKSIQIHRIKKGYLTYKQAQRAYGIQGQSTVLTCLRKHGTLDWSVPIRQTMPRVKETPFQQIKRLEKQLEDERLKNKMLNYMIDLSDRELRLEKSSYPNSPILPRSATDEPITLLQTVRDKPSGNLSGRASPPCPRAGTGPCGGDGAGHTDGNAQNRHP